MERHRGSTVHVASLQVILRKLSDILTHFFPSPLHLFILLSREVKEAVAIATKIFTLLSSGIG